MLITPGGDFGSRNRSSWFNQQDIVSVSCVALYFVWKYDPFSLQTLPEKHTLKKNSCKIELILLFSLGLVPDIVEG